MLSQPGGLWANCASGMFRDSSSWQGKGGGRPGRDGWCLNVDGEILRGTQAAVLEVSVRRGALNLLTAPSHCLP
jgi:hypothetical protein